MGLRANKVPRNKIVFIILLKRIVDKRELQAEYLPSSWMDPEGSRFNEAAE